MVWKMVWAKGETPLDREQIQQARDTFPIGTLENLPPSFLARCRVDTNPEFPDCIVLCYTDNSTPHESVANGSSESSKTFPTYRGIPGRKVAMLGTRGRMEKGARVKPTCGNKYCVNQKHLEYAGTVRNQYVE